MKPSSLTSTKPHRCEASKSSGPAFNTTTVPTSMSSLMVARLQMAPREAPLPLVLRAPCHLIPGLVFQPNTLKCCFVASEMIKDVATFALSTFSFTRITPSGPSHECPSGGPHVVRSCHESELKSKPPAPNKPSVLCNPDQHHSLGDLLLTGPEPELSGS